MQLWVVQVQALALILFTLTSKYAFGTLNYVVGETTRKGFEIMIEIPVFTREEHHTLQILRETEQIEVRMGITADGHTEHASVSAAGMTGMGTGLVGDRDLRELLAIDYGGLVTTPFKYTITPNIRSQVEHFVASLSAKGSIEPELTVRYLDVLIRVVNLRLLGRSSLQSLGLSELCEVTMPQQDAAVLAMHAFRVGAEQDTTTTAVKEKFVYVETGSYLGCSSLFVSHFLAPDVQIYAHDIWVDSAEMWQQLDENSTVPPPGIENYFYQFYDNVKTRGLEKRVIPVRGKSAYTLGIHSNNSVDFAFVDGDHSTEGCLADLRALWPKMKRGRDRSRHSSGDSSDNKIGSSQDSEGTDGDVYTSVILVHDCDILAREEFGTLACVEAFAEEVGHQWHHVRETGIARFSIL